MPKFSDFLDTLTTDQLGHLKQDIAKTDPVSVFKANLQKKLDDLHTQAQPQEVSLRKEFYQAQRDNDRPYNK